MDTEFIKTLFNYGLPAGLLVLTMLGAYRLACSIGAFLAPLVQDVAKQHVQTMSAMETVGHGLLKQFDAQASLLKSSGGKIDEIHEEVVEKKKRA